MSLRAEASIIVNKPVETVFTFGTDFETLTRWSIIKEIRPLSETDDPTIVGSRAVMAVEFLSKKIETTVELTIYEPNRQYAYKSVSGPVSFENSAIFTPVEGGTKVDLILEGEPGGFFKIAGPAIVPLARKQLEDQLHKLKKQLEA